jgi:hypothetical protein
MQLAVIKYTNSVEFVTGQFYYTSEEGKIPEISETASLTAPESTFATRKQFSNVTQIFHETVSISYAKESNMATLEWREYCWNKLQIRRNELDFQTAQKMYKNQEKH